MAERPPACRGAPRCSQLLTRQQEMYHVLPDIDECVRILSEPTKIDFTQFYENMTSGCID